MSEIAIGGNASRILPVLDRIAVGCVLISPLLLLHAHGFAEAAFATADICFLSRSAITRDWTWAWTPWLRIGWAWWSWLILCSLPVPALHMGHENAGSLTQAVLLLRFLVLVAALEHAILASTEARKWLYRIVAAAAAYIAAQTLFQFITGYNLFGEPIGGDGELTGPFGKPRAGPAFTRIILPALVPWASRMPTLLAWPVLIGGGAVSLLIGQRMPLLLTCLGLVVVALLLPRLRWGVLAAGVAMAVLLAASPFVAPHAHHRLVDEFSFQMEHFAISHYGKLYARAAEIAVQNPITGLGDEGYHLGCPNPRYFRPNFDGSIADDGGAVICWHHPHNFYLEELVDGGIPGLILFSALAVAWLMALGRGLWRHPDPLRVGLFAATFVNLWPIASTSAFTSMPIGGWSFLLLGWGLAEARWLNRLPAPI